MCDISIAYIAPLPIFSRSLPSSSHSFPSPGSFALLMLSKSSLILISHTEENGPMTTTDGAVALFLASLRTCHRPANQGLRPRVVCTDLDRDTLPCYTKTDEVEKGPTHPLKP